MKALPSLNFRKAVTIFTVLLAQTSGNTWLLHAQDPSEALLIQQGFQIAPVSLNLAGLDRNLVGLGSYLVNAVANCNGCHGGGGTPNFGYAIGGNPYFGQPQKVDSTVYLSGGQNFGPVGAQGGASIYEGPDIVARNLTPDSTGLPAGGRTLSDFMQMMRTGIDLDHSHPTCTTLTSTPPDCIPASADNPVDGNLLQVMPWPAFQTMGDHYLQAIYAYLVAIPCAQSPIVQNDRLVGTSSKSALRRANFPRCGPANESINGRPLPIPCIEGPTSPCLTALPIKIARP